jgi:RNA polymerase sigma factor (sigma-70 family)
MTTGKFTFFPGLDQQITEFRQAFSAPASAESFSRPFAQQPKPRLSPYTKGFLVGVAVGAGIAVLPEGALPLLLLPGVVKSVADAYSAAALAVEATGQRAAWESSSVRVILATPDMIIDQDSADHADQEPTACASTPQAEHEYGEPEGQASPVGDFDAFYLGNFRLIRNIVNTRAQDWDLAQEVTDEAMLIAYRKWDELREHPNPVAFVVVTARRILSRVQRQQARKSPPGGQVSLSAVPGLEVTASGADPADIAVHRTDLERAMRALPPDQRECLVLHAVLGYSVRDIAAWLNIPEGTVKTRMRTARQSLLEILSDQPGKEDPR